MPTNEWHNIDTLEDAERIAVRARAAKDARAKSAGKRGIMALKNRIPVSISRPAPVRIS